MLPRAATWRVIMKTRRKKKIGIIVFDGCAALDLVGPADAFAVAKADDLPAYEVSVLGVSARPVTAESGVRIIPDTTLAQCSGLDTVIVPGGSGLRREKTGSKVAAWLKNNAPRFRRVASVCTGIYALATSGLLDGREVTTHWRFATDVAQKFPALKVNPDAIFIKDGRFFTSAGITAGIDLALALIEEDLGTQAAMAVARELVVYLKRPGNQEQYAEPLRYQADSADRIAEVGPWIAGHLQHELTLEALAERANLSPRHFSRRFSRAFGMTPAAFVERVRLDSARERLAKPGARVSSVADSVGYSSPDSFRRAFERCFGVSPAIYRRSFRLHSTDSAHPEGKRVL